MPAKDPAVRAISSRIAATERHHPKTSTAELRRQLRAAKAAAYLTRLLAETPALSEEDKAHLSRLLTDPRTEAPTAPDAR
jgi:hypothetical protein